MVDKVKHEETAIVVYMRGLIRDQLIKNEGRQEGLQEGLREGLQKARLLDIKNLMDCTGWSAEKAMDTLKIPSAQRTILYRSLSKNM